jgi:hypothetical protein
MSASSNSFPKTVGAILYGLVAGFAAIGQEEQKRTALFGHSSQPLPLSAGVFPRNESHVTGQRPAIYEPPRIAQEYLRSPAL